MPGRESKAYICLSKQVRGRGRRQDANRKPICVSLSLCAGEWCAPVQPAPLREHHPRHHPRPRTAGYELLGRRQDT